jgi:hypothetical protein
MDGCLKSTRNISNSSRRCHSPYKTNTVVWIGLPMLIILVTAATISRAGEAITIDNSFLKKHLTELKNPRLLTIDDIKNDYEKVEMEGCSFVVKEDFNKDGYDDYAIAGKYDGPFNEKSLFITILTVKNDIITVEYMDKFSFAHDRVFLCSEPGSNYIIENVDKKYDVIAAVMAFGTEWVWLIVWDGKKYITPAPESWTRASYDTTPPVTTPSPPEGLYTSALSVTLTCTDAGGSDCDKIYYTVGGAMPTTSSDIYSSPIPITQTSTLRFFAQDHAGNSEPVNTAVYIVDPRGRSK